MNKKLKNMEYLLNFGSFILLFAIMFVIFNLGDGLELTKVILGFVFSLVIYGLSYFVEKSLKIHDSASLIHFEALGMFLYFFFYAGSMEVFGTWFSLNGDGLHIFLAVLAFIVSALLVLTKVRFKNYMYINFSYVSTLIGIYNIFKFLSLSYLDVAVILVILVLLPYLIVKNQKYVDFLKYLLCVLVIYSLLLVVNNDLCVSSILAIILGIVSNGIVAIRNKDLESKYLCVLVYYGMFFVIGWVFSNYLDDELVLILVALFGVIMDLALNYFVKYFGKQTLAFNKIVYTIFLFVIVSISLGMHHTTLLVISIFAFISSVTVLKIFKDDLSEKYLFPFKLGLLVYSLLFWFSMNVITIPDLLGIFIMNFVFLGMNVICKNDRVRGVYTVLSIAMLLWGMMVTDSESLVSYISILFMMLFDYLVLIVRGNKDVTLLGKIIYSVMLVASLVMLNNYDAVGDVRYLLETIFLLLLFVSNDKLRFNIGLTIPLTVFSLSTYVSLVVVNYTVSSILVNILVVLGTILFAYYMFKRDEHKDLFLALILGMIVARFAIMNFGDTILSIYAISLVVAGIITSLKINYRKSFISGICVGIISLVMILRSIEGIPASVYLLLLGLGVVGFAVYMIAKYQKTENEKVRFCEQCGTKHVGPVETCTKCGAKIID